MTAAAVRDIRTAATRSVVEPVRHPGTLYVAIVHSPEGVRFAAEAPASGR
jgi:hypothetical protein